MGRHLSLLILGGGGLFLMKCIVILENSDSFSRDPRHAANFLPLEGMTIARSLSNLERKPS
jgi:hypothetical protein